MSSILLLIALLSCILCTECLSITKHVQLLTNRRKPCRATILHLSTADFRNGMTFELGKRLDSHLSSLSDSTLPFSFNQMEYRSNF